MNFLARVKIIPLLVVVAMLAFSVRLVDFAVGVRSLNGEAVAADEMAPDDMLLSPITGVEPSAADDETDTEMEMAAASDEDVEDIPVSELEETDWRDPVYDGSGFSQATRDVLEDMAERRKMLDQRERELATREALLRAAEQEIERKFEEMSNLRSEIEGLLVQQSEEEAARIESLVKIYEGMKPKEAARIFDTLDLDVLTAVLSRMSERRLSPILANMNPERARTVTILLAQEKQLPDFPANN